MSVFSPGKLVLTLWATLALQCQRISWKRIKKSIDTAARHFFSKEKDIVAAQMYEFSYTENPPNCVGGIRELFYCLVIASLLLALLLNTSRSLLLLRINCLVSTVVTHS